MPRQVNRQDLQAFEKRRHRRKTGIIEPPVKRKHRRCLWVTPPQPMNLSRAWGSHRKRVAHHGFINLFLVVTRPVKVL